MTRLSFLLLLFASFSALVCTQTSNRVSDDPRMLAYDVSHYDLSIDFTPGGGIFTGSVRVAATVAKSMDECVLSASDRTLTVDSVVIAGKKPEFRHKGEYLVITLPSPQETGEVLVLTVYYHGKAVFKGNYDDGGVFITLRNRIATSSEPRFAHRWWPCKDMPSDKATASVSITVPDSMTAASNGLLLRTERQNGRATYHWSTRYPIATYLVSVAAAVYREFSDTYIGLQGEKMPITYYVFPEDLERAQKDFQHTPEILKFFAQNFCEYPFIKEKFGYAEVEGDLTMENQTMCSIQNQLVRGDLAGEPTFVHETSHHWWGDLITPANWHHTWLNEGFASYAEALYAEHIGGRPAYLEKMQSMMNVPQGAYAGSVVGRSDTSFWDSFSGRVYAKGAIVLHMLRGVMGDTLFFAAMRSYLLNPAYRYANASTGDFMHTCEQTSGKPLQWFFDQWLFAKTDSIDRPELLWDYKQTERAVKLTIDQTTAPLLLYRLPLTISMFSGGSKWKYNIVDSLARQTFTWSVTAPVDSVLIDKENWTFKTLKERKGE